MQAFIATFIAMAASMTICGLATQHTVGDDLGWTIPIDPNFYSNWASRQSFTVGDTLTFKFPNGTHDVANVPKDGYDRCDADDASWIIETGPAIVNITDAGDHYYICAFEGHCLFHQKLAIKIAPTTTPSV